MKDRLNLASSGSPLLLVLFAAILWSTGGLFIKATTLSGVELSFGRSLLAVITIAIVTRREGFGLNRVTAITSVLYAALLLLFVLATKLTTAANAIFLQYTAPVYVLILEPLFYKEKFRLRDLLTTERVGAIEQAIINRLKTRKGELAPLGHAGYGSRHHELIGEPNVERVRNLIKLYVMQALRDEPRIERLLRVDVRPDHDPPRETVRISISARLIGEQTPLNLVVPFSLELGA